MPGAIVRLRDIELPNLPPAILAKRRSIAETALRRAIRAGVKIALGTDSGCCRTEPTGGRWRRWWIGE